MPEISLNWRVGIRWSVHVPLISLAPGTERRLIASPSMITYLNIPQASLTRRHSRYQHRMRSLTVSRMSFRLHFN